MEGQKEGYISQGTEALKSQNTEEYEAYKRHPLLHFICLHLMPSSHSQTDHHIHNLTPSLVLGPYSQLHLTCTLASKSS